MSATICCHLGRGCLRALSEKRAHLPLSLTLIPEKGSEACVWQSKEAAVSGPPAFPSGALSPSPSPPLASRSATVLFRVGWGEAPSHTGM